MFIISSPSKSRIKITVEDVEDAIPKYHAKIDRDIQIKHLAKPWQSEEAKP